MALELKTYGDLKKVLKAISLKQKGDKVLSRGKEIAVDAFLSFIPGAGVAKTTFDVISAIYKSPDNKKTNSWLDNLNIDDDYSKIIDDTVENGFLQVLYSTIEQNSNDKPLEADFDLNEKLKEYLKKHYAGRTVAGLNESKKRRLSEQQETEDSANIKKAFNDNIESTNKDIKDIEKDIKDTENDIKQLNVEVNKNTKILTTLSDTSDRNYYTSLIKKSRDKKEEKEEKMKTLKSQLESKKKELEIQKKTAQEIINATGKNLEEKFVPKKTTKVIFDKSTGNPWEVSFTDRGFQIGETRLSFENVENAIDKNFNIILDAGNGLVLDQNKLNKILKYKGRV